MVWQPQKFSDTLGKSSMEGKYCVQLCQKCSVFCMVILFLEQLFGHFNNLQEQA